MAYKCVVLIKQVPDTKSITGDVMNDDGTVKRSALPAIFNPEDLNALELALQIKDRFGGHITVITMGLPAASAVLRPSGTNHLRNNSRQRRRDRTGQIKLHSPATGGHT